MHLGTLADGDAVENKGNEIPNQNYEDTKHMDRSSNVDWSQLTHAYGSASDVPGLMEAGRTDDQAVWDLSNVLIHQGSLYPATPVAMPIVARFALDPDYAGRLVAIEMIAFYGGQVDVETALNDQHSGIAGPEFDRTCRAALAECTRIIAPLLDDLDQDVRAHAVCACQWLDTPDPDVSQGLVRALEVRRWLRLSDDLTTGDVRRAALAGLARQGLLTTDTARMGARDKDRATRFVAAWGLARIGNRDSSTLRALADNWAATVELNINTWPRMEDPVVMLAQLDDPWPVVTGLADGPEAAAEGALEVAQVLHHKGLVDTDSVMLLARKVGVRREATLKQAAGKVLKELGAEAAAVELWTRAVGKTRGKLSKKKLAAIVNLIHSGGEPQS
ncbi:MAG: hypothetical protein FWF02_13630 [Micrococcales bacterium]|nr:hypothetical protein [Micrococcales bacterium]MCL2668717.1 hypothetical protein [Micrococcales bacterium]